VTDFKTLWARLQIENFYWKIGFYALCSAGLVHALFIPLFLLINLPVMAFINVFSVFIYWYSIFGLGLQTIETRNDGLIGWLVFTELIGHNLLATYYLGKDAGFEYYIYVLAVLPFFIFTYRQSVYLFRIFLVISLALLIDVSPLFKTPKISVSQETLSLIHHLNLFVFLAVLSALSYLYALYAKAHQDQLESHVYIDPLSGLYNRRFVYEMQKEIESRQNGWENPAFLLVDIDHFKAFNDTYGHDCGDTAIAQVATSLQKNLSNGIAVRWGGEEFLLLFKRADPATLQTAAERIRQIIATHPTRCRHGNLPLTVTAGGTIMREGESFHAALKRADTALYQGKHLGRNRVVLL